MGGGRKVTCQFGGEVTSPQRVSSTHPCPRGHQAWPSPTYAWPLSPALVSTLPSWLGPSFPPLCLHPCVSPAAWRSFSLHVSGRSLLCALALHFSRLPGMNQMPLHPGVSCFPHRPCPSPPGTIVCKAPPAGNSHDCTEGGLPEPPCAPAQPGAFHSGLPWTLWGPPLSRSPREVGLLNCWSKLSPTTMSTA